MLNKKNISAIVALCLAAGVYVPYVNAENKGDLKEIKEIVMPAGSMEAQTAKIEYKDLAPMFLFEDDTEEKNTELTGFYMYGSDYGRDYFVGTENAEKKLAFYDAILEDCKEIANLDEDIPLEEFEYETGIEYHPKYSVIESDLDIYDTYTVYFTFRNDHPEFYWLSNALSLAQYDDGTIEASICVYDEYQTAESRKNMDDKIELNFNAALEEIGERENDYETIKAVHDTLCNMTDYGYMQDENGNYYVDEYGNKIPLDTPTAHSIVAMFDGDEETDGVCESYAKSFQLMLNALDINNIYVTGNANGEHAWNMAEIDGNCYYFDVTWDDQEEITYNYFAGGTEAFDDHILNTENAENPSLFLYSLPEVSERGYVKPYEAEYTFDIDVLLGKYTDDEDTEALRGILISVVKDGEELVYGDDYVMYDADGNILENNTFNEYFGVGGAFLPAPSETVVNVINSLSMGVKYNTTIKFTPIYEVDGSYTIYENKNAEFTALAQNGTPTDEPTNAPTATPTAAPTATPPVNDPVFEDVVIDVVDLVENKVTITVAEGKAENIFAVAVTYDENDVLSTLQFIALAEGKAEYDLDNVPDKIMVWTSQLTPKALWENTAD